MSDQLDPWDRSLYDALVTTEGDHALDQEQLAELSGLPVAVLDALERLGILIPQSTSPTLRYDRSAADALRAGKVLLEKGVPLDELLNLAEQVDEVMRPVAARVVDVFVRFVRDSVEFAATSDHEASQALVEAYRSMLEAAEHLVAGHFRRVLLETARATLEDSITA